MPPNLFSFKLKPGSKDGDGGLSSISSILAQLSIGRKNEPVPDTIRTHLPTELYRHIFSLLPPDAKLYPLLFVDYSTHAEVERLLYTDISLEGDQMGQSGSYRQRRGGNFGSKHVQRRILLFKTLSQTPRLSRMVRSLVVPPFICLGHWYHSESRNLRYVYWHLLNLALRAMPNLKELSISQFYSQADGGEELDIQRLPAVINGCSFRLRKLGLLDYPYSDLEILEKDALGGQLEDLTISRELDNLGRGRTLPRLVALEVHGECQTAFRIMATSQNIRSVYMAGCSLQTRQIYTRDLVVHSYLGIRSLRIGLFSEGSNNLHHWYHAIPRFMVAFPSISFFRVDYPFVEESHLALAIRELAPALCALHRMKKIVFCSGCVESRNHVGYRWTIGDNLISQSREIAQELFTNIPQLEVARVGFEEWTRIHLEGDKRTASTVSDNPNEWKDKVFWR